MSSKNKNKQRKGNRVGKSLSDMSQFAARAHVVGRNVPFKIGQTTSGTGCLVNNNTGPTLSNVNTVVIDPYTLGSRAALLAAEFAQWRVRKMTVQYETDATSSGVVNTQAGPTTTPSYGSRPFALGWNKDPDISFSTHTSIIEAGGLSHNTSKDSSVIRLPSSGWLYTSTTTGYPGSAIDNRMVVHGQLLAAFVDASTTAAATYGRIIISYDIDFRYPQNSSVIGAALDFIQKQLKPKQRQENEEKQNKYELISPGAAPTASWFRS